MARLPAATRESVPENQQDAFDQIVGNGGAAPPYGPGSVMIHVPEASLRATALNQYLRNESSLPNKILELAMLVTAREMDCQHIWNAHAASGRTAGLPDEVVDGLREGEDLTGLAADEQAVIDYGRELFREHHVSRGAYQAALEQLGRQGLVELTLVLGNYAMLALNVNAFDTDLPPNRTEPMLPL